MIFSSLASRHCPVRSSSTVFPSIGPSLSGLVHCTFEILPCRCSVDRRQCSIGLSGKCNTNHMSRDSRLLSQLFLSRDQVYVSRVGSTSHFVPSIHLSTSPLRSIQSDFLFCLNFCLSLIFLVIFLSSQLINLCHTCSSLSRSSILVANLLLFVNVINAM